MEILPFLADGQPSRLEMRWHVGALKLAGMGEPLVRLIEGIGRLDVSLRAITPQLFDGIFESATWDAGILIDYETLSALWTMGCARLLRAVDDERWGARTPDERVKALRKIFSDTPLTATGDRVALAELLLDYLDALPHTLASQDVETDWLRKAS